MAVIINEDISEREHNVGRSLQELFHIYLES